MIYVVYLIYNSVSQLLGIHGHLANRNIGTLPIVMYPYFPSDRGRETLYHGMRHLRAQICFLFCLVLWGLLQATKNIATASLAGGNSITPYQFERPKIRQVSFTQR